MTSPIGCRRAVDRHGRPVVDLLDLVGDVGQQVVGVDGQRLRVDQRPARRRQRDHPRRHVAVQRRAHDHDAAFAGERQQLVDRRRPVAGDEQADAELDRRPLRVVAVADHDDVARADLGSAASRRPSPGTRSGRRPRRSRRHTPSGPAAHARSRSTLVGASSSDGSRESRMYRRASERSVITPASAPSPSTIGTRSRSSRAISRPTSRTGSPSPACGNSRRITSLTRSITCARNSGSGACARESTQRVCSLTSPSRTGTYSLRGSTRRISSA